MTQFLIFGASITYGLYDTEGGWSTRLRKYLDTNYVKNKGDEYRVYNLAIDGTTTEQLLTRIEFAIKQRMFESKKDEFIFIFSIGINDSQFFNDKKIYRTPPEKFAQNINKLIKIARKFTDKVIFVSLTPVDESRVDPIPWRLDRSYKNIHIEKYNKIIKDIFDRQNCHFVDVFTELKKQDLKTLLRDGIHPDDHGHEMIFEILRDFLISNKLIK